MLVATPIYAGLAGLMLIFLSAYTIRARAIHSVSVGDGANKVVQKAMRLHANFVEYMPLSLLLLGLAEWQGYSVFIIHLFGIALLSGRILHFFGMGATPQIPKLRVGGMMLTLISIGVLSLAVLLQPALTLFL